MMDRQPLHCPACGSVLRECHVMHSARRHTAYLACSGCAFSTKWQRGSSRTGSIGNAYTATRKVLKGIRARMVQEMKEALTP
jgi:formate dehydrogenase maturation protein FdhE